MISGVYELVFWGYVAVCALVLLLVAFYVRIFTEPSCGGFFVIIAYAFYEMPFIGLFYLLLILLQE